MNKVEFLSVARVPFAARYDNFIGGKFVAPVSGRYFDNASPVNGQVVCQIARSDHQDVEAALDAAHAAKEAWARAGQLIVYASTQVPHMIRVGLAKFLGLDQGLVRVISPDVGGGFGYKVIVHPEELCVAWLALKFRRPFRYIEDRREHLVVGANSRQHGYRVTAHADERGKLLALDAEVTIDGGAYSAWPFTVALAHDQAPATVIESTEALLAVSRACQNGGLDVAVPASPAVTKTITSLAALLALEAIRSPWNSCQSS